MTNNFNGNNQNNQNTNDINETENIITTIGNYIIILCSIIISILLFFVFLKNRRMKKQKQLSTQNNQTYQPVQIESSFDEPVDFNQLAERFSRLSLDPKTK